MGFPLKFMSAPMRMGIWKISHVMVSFFIFYRFKRLIFRFVRFIAFMTTYGGSFLDHLLSLDAYSLHFTLFLSLFLSQYIYVYVYIKRKWLWSGELCIY